MTIFAGASGGGSLATFGSDSVVETDAAGAAGTGALSVAFLTGVVAKVLPDDLLVSEAIDFSTAALVFRGGHSLFSFSSAFAASPDV